LLSLGLAANGCGGGKATGGSASQSAATQVPPAATAAAPAAATELWVDPTYAPDRTTLASLAITPVPSAGANAHQLDEALERVFIDTPGSQLRAQPADIRRRMNGNRQFVLLIDRIRSVQYAPTVLPTASLAQILTPKEHEDLRTQLNSASMLVVPVEFVVEPKGAGTDGRALYRVYSLQSGKLLLQNKLVRHVDAGGDAGQRETTIQLLLAMQADFADRLMP
jgi:hypothetical protein